MIGPIGTAAGEHITGAYKAGFGYWSDQDSK